MKIFKKIFFVLLFIGSTANLFAQIQQNEGNWWYFGIGSGLNFNIKNTPKTSSTGSIINDLPIPITGPMLTNEGCFSLSDSDGNLLMFGDGSTIWNRNHQIMQNATNLGGHSSSAQSGLIMPVPGTSNKYYAFSVAYESNNNGIRYAIVDMSLNGGLGGIATENGVLQKNILIQGPGNAENIAAVMNPDGSGFWIINWSPISESINRFRVYKATSLGITLHSSKDVTSYGSNYLASQLKFNTEGTKFVSGSQMFVLYYGDFDPQSGIITHLGLINLNNYNGFPFGLEFSPNSEYVYIAQLGGHPLRQVPWSSIRSGTLNGTYTYTSNYYPANIQLAPDGRIYGIFYETRDLYVILNPNIQGSASNIQRMNSYLLNSSFLGLPNFNSGYLALLPEINPLICKGNSYNFSVEIPVPTTQELTPTQLVWNWGDGSATQTQPYVTNQTKYIMGHNYQTIGEKNIQVQIFRNQTLLRTITLKREITDCNLQLNRMIRVNVDNESTQKTKNP